MAVGDGRLSVADASAWAGARVQEGHADETMCALAACCAKNGERDLHGWANDQPWRQCLPQPFSFMAPLAHGETAYRGMLHCLLPHEVFRDLAKGAPRVFEEIFGTAEERAQYWAEMARTAAEAADGPRAAEHWRWLQSHPTAWAPAQQRIPIGCHGDGGTMHGGEKVTAVSWGGLCRGGSTVDTRLLFIVLKESEMDHVQHRTLYAAFEVLAWSFRAMATGLHPAVDHNGEAFTPARDPERFALAGSPLACGPDCPNLLGAWAELRGDWVFLREALNLACHFGAKQVCHLRAATQEEGPLHYGNFSREGLLRGSLVGPVCTRGASPWQAREPPSPLCKIPGFSIWRCMFDIMHALELGLLQRCIPAALQGTLGLPEGESRRAAEAPVWPAASRCQKATAAYLQWRCDAKVPASSRVKRITARWVKGRWPTISQEHAKAAALRAMLPWVAGLADARAHNSQVACLRARCLRGFMEMDAAFRGQPRFLAAEQAGKVQAHCLDALQALAQLQELRPSGPRRVVPQGHALLHIACDSALSNPRVAHCYQDEDFIGRAQRLYVAFHGRTAPQRAVQRYCLSTSVQMAAREQLLAGKRPARARPPTGGPLRRLLRQGSAGPSLSRQAAPSPMSKQRGRPRKAGPKRPQGRPLMPRANDDGAGSASVQL